MDGWTRSRRAGEPKHAKLSAKPAQLRELRRLPICLDLEIVQNTHNPPGRSLLLYLSRKSEKNWHAMRRVVVTGLGAVTPLAAGIKQTWRRLLDSQSGIVSTITRGPQFVTLPSRVAGLVPLGSRDDGRWQAKDWLPASEERQMALFAQYAVASAHEALQDAGWHPTKDEDLEMTGVTLGSGIGNLDEAYSTSVAFDRGGYRKISPLFVPRLLINLAAGHVSMRYGFKGPNHAATTACTTGLHAIGDASRMIAFGDANVMVAGGAESCIHPLAIAGFARARSLSTDWNDDPTSSSRPFDRQRAGFVIGEGAGVVILEVSNLFEASAMLS